QILRHKLDQVNQVGLVEVIGGRKRELHVELDPYKLKQHEISATRVTMAIAASGQNIPIGKVEKENLETVFRTLGEFRHPSDIASTVVSFFGNDVPVRVADVGRVRDGLEDEKTRAYINGERAIFLNVYRQSGSNTIAVTDAIKKRVTKLNAEFKTESGHPSITMVRDGSRQIKANVDDVKDSILIGITLTVIVVYLFLGNLRSTIITSLALPNSLIGAFILMAAAGFSINVMTLLALSLTVGLLIDDAIVVRENIFRHLEMGKPPVQAAIEGSKEVLLAVIATTFSVLAVFGPIAFLQGVVGQFFKEFGLTICFAMLISLFDALTIAPMLSAYFAGDLHKKSTKLIPRIWDSTVGILPRAFGTFQDKLERGYVRLLHFTLRHRLLMIGIAIGIFALSIVAVKKVPKTFLPAQDFGEFVVALELEPGASLGAMNTVATQVDTALHNHGEVATTVMTVGKSSGESNVATLYVTLVDRKHRKMNTSDFKATIRDELVKFAYAKPIVKDADMVGGGQRAFTLNLIGSDLKQLEDVAQNVMARVKDHPALLDVELGYKPGKPEFQVDLDDQKAAMLGISNSSVGQELRTQVEGSTPAVFRENGNEYDVRVRLQPEYRDLKARYGETYVPNINQTLVRLANVARPVSTVGPASITRQDRGRYIQIAADIAPDGPGIGGAMTDIKEILDNEIKLPPGVTYRFVGQAENFKELGQNMMIAALLGVLFIFLVLASLYESFVTPFTILLVLPLAACGAFYALFVTQHSLDIFSMIGCIMLLGISTKNSILLVDYTNQMVQKGMDHSTAVIEAGKTRLRPILMTTFALIAGMLPIAMGLNEASRQRTSMGIAIIGGLISSTLLTLVVVPAAYSYMERFRVWSLGKMKKLFMPESTLKPKSKAH
ncbi:MAG: efflux RND transporter permease subunit, partial [Candidatus Margulisiibacteriota bacterium]